MTLLLDFFLIHKDYLIFLSVFHFLTVAVPLNQSFSGILYTGR